MVLEGLAELQGCQVEDPIVDILPITCTDMDGIPVEDCVKCTELCNCPPGNEVEYCFVKTAGHSAVEIYLEFSIGEKVATEFLGLSDVGDAKKMSPVLECVADLGDGFLQAHFGYDNKNSQSIRVPLGEDNKFTPALTATPDPEIPPVDPAETPYLSDAVKTQPFIFMPGRVRGFFDVTFKEDEVVVWTLKGPDNRRRTATASNNPVQRCN